MSNLKVSLIIPTFRRDEWLKQSLKCALNQTLSPTEIIVVDQTIIRDEATQKYFDEYIKDPRIKWVRQEEASVTSARNLAAKIASCELLIFVDDDVFFETEFVAQHVSMYSRYPSAAVAGQVKIFPWDHPCRKHPRVKWNSAEALDSLPYREGQRVFKIQGCNWSVKRDVYMALGGVDEAFKGPSWGEEDDFACRMGDAYPIFFSQKAEVIHFRGAVGGCRVEPTQKHTELQKWSCVFLFTIRHKFWMGQRDVNGRLISQSWVNRWYRALRNTVLIKKNVLSPWRLLLKMPTLYQALRQSKKLAKKHTNLSTFS